jgi:hypothetical protein
MHYTPISMYNTVTKVQYTPAIIARQTLESQHDGAVLRCCGKQIAMKRGKSKHRISFCTQHTSNIAIITEWCIFSIEMMCMCLSPVCFINSVSSSLLQSLNSKNTVKDAADREGLGIPVTGWSWQKWGHCRNQCCWNSIHQTRHSTMTIVSTGTLRATAPFPQCNVTITLSIRLTVTQPVTSCEIASQCFQHEATKFVHQPRKKINHHHHTLKESRKQMVYLFNCILHGEIATYEKELKYEYSIQM